MKTERIIGPAGTGALALCAILKFMAAFEQPHHAPQLASDAMMLTFWAVVWCFLFLRLGKRSASS